MRTLVGADEPERPQVSPTVGWSSNSTLPSSSVAGSTTTTTNSAYLWLAPAYLRDEAPAKRESYRTTAYVGRSLPELEAETPAE